MNPDSSRGIPQRRLLSRALFVSLLLLPPAAALLGGMFALSAAGSHEYRTAHALVQATVKPSAKPGAELVVPLLDWGVRVEPFHAPIAVTLELRTIDRERLVRAVASPERARAELDQLQEDGSRTVRRSLRRAAIVWFTGAVIGGALGGTVVAVVLLARRWVAAGTIAGAAVGAVVLVAVGGSLASYDPDAFDRPQFTGRADELSQLVSFSEGLLEAGDAYESHYATALASISNATGIARSGLDAPADRRLLLASDVHNNALVLDGFGRAARGAPVVLAGDFGQLGARFEEPIARRLARVGSRVVAVSGNHDSRSFMASLESAGVRVLRRGKARCDGGQQEKCEPDAVTLHGLRVMGYDDPLEARSAGIARRVLTLPPLQRVREQERFVSWFEALRTQPDAVVVHQHGLAHALATRLQEQGRRRPLLLLTGHDHRAHVERVGSTLIVDGGTLGAGGPAAVGEQDASFAVVWIRGRSVHAVDLVSIEPVSGRAAARRLVVRTLRDRVAVRATPATVER